MNHDSIICVCGAGTMGSGIAQVAAQAGFTTIQFDLNAEMLDKSRAVIHKNLDTLMGKGKISAEEKAAISSRLSFTHEPEDCRAQVVIEAIVEKLEAKTQLFTTLAALNGPDCLLATNTSSIAIGTIAASIPHPERVVGMHFFNPAPLMKLVEVIQGPETSEAVVAQTLSLARVMGKTPVLCKDAPGFIVNRVARHYYLEAMRMVEQGKASIENVDAVMEAAGFKMGPFKLMDLIGMDINYGVSNIVWEVLGKPERLRPSDLQRDKVAAGELGRKTGKGFYQYTASAQ